MLTQPGGKNLHAMREAGSHDPQRPPCSVNRRWKESLVGHTRSSHTRGHTIPAPYKSQMSVCLRRKASLEVPGLCSPPHPHPTLPHSKPDALCMFNSTLQGVSPFVLQQSGPSMWLVRCLGFRARERVETWIFSKQMFFWELPNSLLEDHKSCLNVQRKHRSFWFAMMVTVPLLFHGY